MQLPADLAAAIEEEAERQPARALRSAARELAEAYRAGRAADLETRVQAVAYAATRLPATYAAARAVLAEVRERAGLMQSVLDLGAGSGAVAWAARDVFGLLERVTLVERSLTLVALGQHLGAPATSWRKVDLSRAAAFEPHDLVVCSYVIGEAGTEWLPSAWAAAERALVVIEPGTPAGFARIRNVRDWLLAAGAHLAAPCPHEGQCPMSGSDWCHFAARVERSSLHRKLKEGSLGYEDEKYSYVAVTREPVTPAAARILRHPQVRPGVIELTLCTTAGVEPRRVAKREKEAFRAARRARWGGAW